MNRAFKPRIVPEPADAPVDIGVPDMSYESRDRNHIMRRDWSRVHIAADRRRPMFLADFRGRGWMK